MKRPITAAMLLATLAAATLSTPASAGHHRPPKTSLFFKKERVQGGNLISYCWGGDGVSMCADGVPNYPKAVTVPDDSRLKIRIHRDEKPSGRSLYAYFEVDENEYPQGDAKRLPTKMTRVWRDGKVVAWDAHFTVWRKDAHYYIDLDTYWPQGDALHEFHVRTEE
jgi:hypothetical protein